MRIVKTWGHEEWITVTDKYCLKKLVIKEGQAISLQYHRYKEETWYIAEGKGLLNFDGEKSIMEKEDTLHIRPMAIHKITSLEGDLVIIEASTIELDDVVRLDI